VVASVARTERERIRRVNFKEGRFEIAVFFALWKGMRSLNGVSGVPDHGREQKNRAD